MNARGIKRVMALAVGLVFIQARSFAEIVLPPVLSSNMVLQRNVLVPIWGMASSGEKITVEFAGQKKETVANAQGKWRVTLNPLKTSTEPSMMIVSSASGKHEIQNILVGEVWVGSGQSNMAGGAGGYAKGDEVLAKMISEGPYPQLRLISSGSKSWMEATPDTIKGFSALLFSFGLPLHKDLKVPVGLLVGAVGGTPSGYWLSQQAYDSDPACKEVVAKARLQYNANDTAKKHEISVEKWQKYVREAKLKGETKFSNEPQKPLNPGECKGKLGNLYERLILPYVPYAIRGVLWDQGESGTAIESIDQYTLMGALINGWRKEWDQDFAFIYVQKPSGGGCAWDSSDPITSKAEKLIVLPGSVPSDGDYRATHVRIMNYPNTFMVTSSDLGAGVHPVNKSGYGARSARVALGAVYGRDVEIYGPVYKAHKVDGQKMIISYSHIGKGLVVKKEAALSASTGITNLQGFTIAGEDGKFVWAEAVVAGDTVVVSNDKIMKPVAVRYAWASKHPWANLFNKDGLPAVPFRTDR